jgi:hypothetical protein
VAKRAVRRLLGHGFANGASNRFIESCSATRPALRYVSVWLMFVPQQFLDVVQGHATQLSAVGHEENAPAKSWVRRACERRLTDQA